MHRFRVWETRTALVSDSEEPQHAPGSPGQQVGRIRLHRPALGRAGARGVQVLLDGQPVAVLADGERAECVTSAGTHHLWAHLDWAGGERVQVQVPAAGVVDLHVVPVAASLSPLRNDVGQFTFAVVAAPGAEQAVLTAPASANGRSRRFSPASVLVVVLAALVLLVVLVSVGGGLR